MFLTGCGSKSQNSAPSQPKQDDRPGNAVVYQRIEAMTDCSKLQRQFDIAYANSERPGDNTVALSYMEAADDRMQKVGCFG